LSELVIRDECITRRDTNLLSLPHDSQIDVEERVKQETPDGTVRKSRNETRARRRGICGEIGHNARTGEKDIEEIEEDGLRMPAEASIGGTQGEYGQNSHWGARM
jgi:hypothetical protein